MKDKLSKTIVINWESYHLNKEIPRDAENLHHIIWKVNRIKYNTNEKLNKVLLNERKHVALNRLFLDHQSPHEQLRDMVKIREPVLSEWVRETLYWLLSLPRWLFYKEELVKKKYLDKELFSDEESKFLKEEI
jgi:hypothetical protein